VRRLLLKRREVKLAKRDKAVQQTDIEYHGRKSNRYSEDSKSLNQCSMIERWQAVSLMSFHHKVFAHIPLDKKEDK
jgi:hypothetical protein